MTKRIPKFRCRLAAVCDKVYCGHHGPHVAKVSESKDHAPKTCTETWQCPYGAAADGVCCVPVKEEGVK